MAKQQAVARKPSRSKRDKQQQADAPRGDTEADYEDSPEADGDQSADGEEPSAFEDDMHELQAELGDDWIVRFSVQGDDAWLTAEKDDGSQRLEAQTADVLVEAVE